jgi:flavin-dependent dehydrogenase
MGYSEAYFDVVIIGTGPAGAGLAAFLGRYGL